MVRVYLTANQTYFAMLPGALRQRVSANQPLLYCDHLGRTEAGGQVETVPPLRQACRPIFDASILSAAEAALTRTAAPGEGSTAVASTA